MASIVCPYCGKSIVYKQASKAMDHIKKCNGVPAADPVPSPQSAKTKNSLRRSKALSDKLAQDLTLAGIPYELEYRFYSSRRWRFDCVIPFLKIAIEIEGGLYERGGGGHNKAKHYIKDLAKYNAAAMLGWTLLRYTPKQIEDGYPALDVLAIRDYGALALDMLPHYQTGGKK